MTTANIKAALEAFHVLAPNEVPDFLRAAAERMEQDQSELQAAWQDAKAGYVWGSMAQKFYSAAHLCERAVKLYFK